MSEIATPYAAESTFIPPPSADPAMQPPMNDPYTSDLRMSENTAGRSAPILPPTRTERFQACVERFGKAIHFEAVLRWRIAYREYLAEFLGTFIMVLFGIGTICQFSFQMTDQADSDYPGICFLWGLAVMSGVYICGGVSGGHINPAITLTFACWRGFPWRKVPGYWFAQFLGAFCAAGVLYLLYEVEINDINMGERTYTGPNATGNAFATYPSPVRGNYSSFFGELLGTACLAAIVFACIDRYNVPPTHCSPIVFALAVTVILGALGSPGGFALNPARDLGPRVFLTTAGYGGEPFTAYNGYAWVPIIGPFIGAVVGGATYDIFIATGPTPEQLEAERLERLEKGNGMYPD